MLELIFVMLIVGILSSVAISRLYTNRDDAIITKAKDTLASVRASIAAQKQKRVLSGNFSHIATLSTDDRVFGGFDGDETKPVLDYGVNTCSEAQPIECWEHLDKEYIFVYSTNVKCLFQLDNDRLLSKNGDNTICKKLEH